MRLPQNLDLASQRGVLGAKPFYFRDEMVDAFRTLAPAEHGGDHLVNAHG